MHVLVAVDEVGQAAEGSMRKAASWLAISIVSRSGRSRRVVARRIISLSGGKWPRAQRMKPLAQRLKRRGQRHMQAERGARLAGIERIQRIDFLAVKSGAAVITEVALSRPRSDQFADGGVDAGRNAVIVGAEPDAAAALRPLPAYSAARERARLRRRLRPWPRSSGCARRRNRPGAP